MATSAVNVVLLLVSLGATVRVVGVAPLELLRVSWRGITGAGVMGLLVWALADHLVSLAVASLLNLLACVACGALVYLTVVGGLWTACGRTAGAERSTLAYLRQRFPGREARP